MIRRIIKIDENKCNGCGACANACHENAIQMVDGKAKLIRDDYCDGLGDCLPTCPVDAISFEEREALPYDEAAVKANMNKSVIDDDFTASKQPSRLNQWPVQIKLMPVKSPYYEDANLLIAADCTAFAYGRFHEDFMKKHITVIGCPKLDSADYSEKLCEIIKNNSIKSVKILRMEVPCCGGLELAANKALQNSNKFLPWQVVTISTNGEILD